MKVYRVFPFDASAGPTDWGGALFVPRGAGLGRIDNPDLYDAFYAAADPLTAIAESFGRFAIWRAETFNNALGLPYALATIDVPAELTLFEMNDIDALRAIGITRPTDVITRERKITQAWARKIFELGEFGGISWWSFYDPDRQVVGIWKHDRIALVNEPDVLTIDRPIVVETAATIVRPIS